MTQQTTDGAADLLKLPVLILPIEFLVGAFILRLRVLDLRWQTRTGSSIM